MTDPVLRVMPHNVAAEKCLLGAIVMDNRAMERVSEFLRPEHFAVGQHGHIYEACGELIAAGRVADNITLNEFFGRDTRLQDIGGTAYLAEIAASAVTVINAGEYGRIIYDLHRRRELIQLGETIVEAVHGEDGADSQIEAAESALYQIAENRFEKGSTPAEQMRAAVAGIEAGYKGEKPPGLETGLVDFDKLFGRLRPQGLYVGAGVTSSGKSILGQGFAERVADEKPVLLCSLEMSAEEIQSRRICAKTRIDFSRLRDGDLSEIEMHQVVKAAQELQSKPLIIDDRGGVTVAYIRQRARRMKRSIGLGLIVVDYIQLVRSSDAARKSGRVQEISEITRDLKTLAKELNVPVVALAQLSRAVDARDDKVPRLSDLEGSGGIERDADVVVFVFREHYYLERNKPAQREKETIEAFEKRCAVRQDRLNKTEGHAELIIGKNRQGRADSVTVSFHGQFMQFGNAARHQNEMNI